MDLSIIILNYNTPLITINCIKSLFDQYGKELRSRKYEIVLVDNKSADDSVTILNKEIKSREWNVTFIKSNKNTGFGGGCNKGANKAKGRFILFLNSDTIVRDRSLNKMMDFLRKNI